MDELQETGQYNALCQRTVLEAFRCFHEATDFEDETRNAISIGGDSNTLAVIAGSMSKAKWGAPSPIRLEASKPVDGESLDT